MCENSFIGERCPDKTPLFTAHSLPFARKKNTWRQNFSVLFRNSILKSLHVERHSFCSLDCNIKYMIIKNLNFLRDKKGLSNVVLNIPSELELH